jgi:hypothetical protein
MTMDKDAGEVLDMRFVVSSGQESCGYGKWMVVACSIALYRTSLEPEKGAARSDNADEERLKSYVSRLSSLTMVDYVPGLAS